VSQISPPIRIVIVAAFAFLAAWMTVLKPKSADVAPVAAAPTVTAPGAAGLGRAVEKAKDAKAAQEASDARVQAATGETSATGAAAKPGSTTAAAKAAPALPAVERSVLAKLPKDLRGPVAHHRIVVLGVVSPGQEPFRAMPADDRALRQELAHVSRDGGRVVVRTVALPDLERYAAIATGAEVAQSPAVIVIDGELHATRLDGFADRDEIQQAVGDARAATDPGLVTFEQRERHVCARYAVWMGRSHSDAARARVKAHYRAALAALTPPAGQAAARLSDCS
jgi:hypothetical protein